MDRNIRPQRADSDISFNYAASNQTIPQINEQTSQEAIPRNIEPEPFGQRLTNGLPTIVGTIYDNHIMQESRRVRHAIKSLQDVWISNGQFQGSNLLRMRDHYRTLLLRNQDFLQQINRALRILPNYPVNLEMKARRLAEESIATVECAQQAIDHIENMNTPLDLEDPYYLNDREHLLHARTACSGSIESTWKLLAMLDELTFSAD